MNIIIFIQTEPLGMVSLLKLLVQSSGEYVNNIHRARMNIGLWPEVRMVDQAYIFAETQERQILTSREIAGKTHTFGFDWGPAGERPEAGIRSSCTALSPIYRKWRGPSLQLYVREIDTSGGT